MDDKAVCENLYRRLLILGDTGVNVDPYDLTHGKQWHAELALQYIERLFNPSDPLVFDDVVARLRKLDRSNSKTTKKFILDLIRQSQEASSLEHPATIFDRDALRLWNAEQEKIRRFITKL